jgi:cation transport protein ChaC
MTLSVDIVESCRRPEVDEGRHPDLTPMPNELYQPLIDRLLNESLALGPLWIFAYGSLIWNPTFPWVEARRATAVGWHRSFCMELQNWRGSRSQPGLMMALDRGGRCNGIAFRIADDEDREEVIGNLVDAEIGYKEDVASIRWLTLHTSQGHIRALTFYAGPNGPGIVRKLPLADVAWRLTRACGHVGPGAEYLYNTVEKLEEHGIHDRNLWTLQRLVALEIISLAELSNNSGQNDQQ